VCVGVVDVVLVIDHERLYNDLQRDLPSSTEVVPLSKSGGVSVCGDRGRVSQVTQIMCMCT